MSSCITLAGVGANHLVHGIYTSFGLLLNVINYMFPPPLSGILIQHFVTIHCAEEYNGRPFLSDIANYGKAAIESNLCVVRKDGKMSALSHCSSHNCVSSRHCARGTLEKKSSVVKLCLVFMSLLHNQWTMFSLSFFCTSFTK